MIMSEQQAVIVSALRDVADRIERGDVLAREYHIDRAVIPTGESPEFETFEPSRFVTYSVRVEEPRARA